MAKDRQLRVRVPASLIEEIIAWAAEREERGDRTMTNLDGSINVSAAARAMLAETARRRRA